MSACLACCIPVGCVGNQHRPLSKACKLENYSEDLKMDQLLTPQGVLLTCRLWEQDCGCQGVERTLGKALHVA